jgi:ectoine hydroxylase-related dioxygenase (phytanoyl-CoA dioxygenase family)
LGRIEHRFSGEQVGADMERVNACLERMELVYVELEPGDVLFFHSNLLHRSDANLSEEPRLTLIAAYNLASNKPYMKEPDSAHLPVEALPDDSILKMGIKVIEEQTDFLTPSRDAALK